MDIGTSELHRRKRTRLEKSRSGTARIRVLDGNEIDKLLWSDKITPEQHSLLTGFQVDAHRAGLLGLRAAPLEARVSGAAHDMSDKDALCFLKHVMALRFVTDCLGVKATRLLQGLCLDDRPVSDDDLGVVRRICSTLDKFRATWSPDKVKAIG